MKKLLLCLALTSSMTVFSDLSQKDETLFRAMNLRDLEAVKEALANGADVNVTNDFGDSPLVWAEREGHIETIQLLLDHGAKIDVVADNDGERILHRAVVNDHIEIVKLLLATGIDVDAKNKYGRTALHQAATFDRIAIAQLLLANNADVDAKNKYGMTVLYDAIKEGSVKMVELLLNHGVDINAIVSDEKKLTPLLFAVKRREKEIVKFLLNRGANRKAVDIDGRTVFDWARFDPEIALLLQK
jgi:ankyrin repeat protein